MTARDRGPSDPGAMNLLAPRRRIDPDVGARICAWVRELYAVPHDGSVFVTELRCADAGCAPVETVVLIAPSAGETFKRKVHKRAVDVTRTDLEEATT